MSCKDHTRAHCSAMSNLESKIRNNCWRCPCKENPIGKLWMTVYLNRVYWWESKRAVILYTFTPGTSLSTQRQMYSINRARVILAIHWWLTTYVHVQCVKWLFLKQHKQMNFKRWQMATPNITIIQKSNGSNKYHINKKNETMEWKGKGRQYGLQIVQVIAAVL